MRTKLVGGMAAIAERAATLEDVVGSIAGQLDVLYVYLNDFAECPAFFNKYGNVVPILAADARGDLSANGKMYFLQYEKEGVALTLDDDIIYPPDYVRAFTDLFDLFEKPIVACVHAGVLQPNPEYYYERAKSFNSLRPSLYNAIATLCGSGTAAFPIAFVHAAAHDFFSEVYVDLQLSLLAHSAKMPLVCMARTENWVTFLQYPGLFEKAKSHISHHTRILKENAHLIHWEYIRGLWRDFLSSFNGSDMVEVAVALRLSPASIDFLQGREYCNQYSAVMELSKLVEFSENLLRGHAANEKRNQ